MPFTDTQSYAGFVGGFTQLNQCKDEK